jgi:hypothetical protein
LWQSVTFFPVGVGVAVGVAVGVGSVVAVGVGVGVSLDRPKFQGLAVEVRTTI